MISITPQQGRLNVAKGSSSHLMKQPATHCAVRLNVSARSLSCQVLRNVLQSIPMEQPSFAATSPVLEGEVVSELALLALLLPCDAPCCCWSSLPRPSGPLAPSSGSVEGPTSPAKITVSHSYSDSPAYALSVMIVLPDQHCHCLAQLPFIAFTRALTPPPPLIPMGLAH